MCAGDLAYGALEHGFESYGAQVLRDMHGWGREFGFLPPDLRGNLRHEMPPVQPFDLTKIANVDFHGDGAPGVPGWAGQRNHDLREMPVGRQTFLGVAFEVIDPAQNGRRACVGLSHRKGYATSVRQPVEKHLATLFFLHTLQGSGLAGWFKVLYHDGSTRTEYVHDLGLEKDRGVPLASRIEPWTDPSDPGDKSTNYMDFFATPEVRPAWTGRSPESKNVGVGLWAWQNPKPELAIDAIEFHAAENKNIWFILALSGTATPAKPAPAKISGGYHPLWGAGLVTQALIQGLAGIQDQGVAFDRLRLAPRWLAAGVAEATACARYPESDGYARYHYRYDHAQGRLRVDLAARAEKVALELLLPEGKQARAVALNGSQVELVEKQVEQSRYVCLELCGVRAHTVEVQVG